MSQRDFWAGRRVFLTGHTGFKGSWLSLWLSRLGAQVHGYALAPPTTPALFEVARVRDRLAGHVVGDVRDRDALSTAMAAADPEIVIHMAAQPLVRDSYRLPVETYAINVMGTVNLLDAARRHGRAAALVNVTTDKCYENQEWVWGYREIEPMGGRDVYSNSKACSELITAAWRASFQADGGPFIGSGRAGNVIGGGDWARDRILPDMFRAFDAGEPLMVRHPDAIRPWQHVLEPLSGYLALAEKLVAEGAAFAEPWNFGPADDDARPVSWILGHMTGCLPSLVWDCEGSGGVHEANFLKLDSSKAHSRLDWHPRWRLATALDKTAEWHLAWNEGQDMAKVTDRQIADYEGTSAHV